MVIRQPFPNLADLLIGSVYVVLGLTLFVKGLDTALFPLGESMAHGFARKGSLPWLLIFAFSLGFGTTVAEPALTAVAAEAASAAAQGGAVDSSEQAQVSYALGCA
ncbi:MAG: MFS family permease [Gammaproteobacteria bacterium]